MLPLTRVWSPATRCVFRYSKAAMSVYLPASEFWGQLGEEVGRCPGASMRQRAGVVMGQGGRRGWSRVYRGAAVSQLSSVKGAADRGAPGQAASVCRRRGRGSAGPSDADGGGRRCRHAVAQGTGTEEEQHKSHLSGVQYIMHVWWVQRPSYDFTVYVTF